MNQDNKIQSNEGDDSCFIVEKPITIVEIDDSINLSSGDVNDSNCTAITASDQPSEYLVIDETSESECSSPAKSARIGENNENAGDVQAVSIIYVHISL
jgi:hypothetical protein